MPTVKYNQPCPVSDITITFPSTSGTLQLAGAGGITGFTSQISTAAPNATTNVSQLLVAVSTTNGDIALEPKGNGAILAQIPDNATTAGGKRGQYAVDLQRIRSSSGRVASGNYSVILGGQNNGAYSTEAFIGGGNSNQVVGTFAAVVGGQVNTININGSYGAIGGGYGNTINALTGCIAGGYTSTSNGAYSFIGGGHSNYTGNQYSCVVGGFTNSASGQYSFIGGGAINTCSQNYATLSGGYLNYSQGTYASVGGGFANNCSGTSSTIVGGQSNVCSGAYSTVLGGTSNTIDSTVQYSFVGGRGGRVRDSGTFVLSNYSYNNILGDTQLVDAVYQGRTSNATPTFVGLAGGSLGVLVPANSCVTFEFLVTARQQSSSNVAGWIITGVCENTGGTLTFYNVTVNLVHRNVGTWNVSVLENTGTVGLQVTGTANTIQWTASARFALTLI